MKKLLFGLAILALYGIVLLALTGCAGRQWVENQAGCWQYRNPDRPSSSDWVTQFGWGCPDTGNQALNFKR
jgi:hypothetical protein